MVCTDDMQRGSLVCAHHTNKGMSRLVNGGLERALVPWLVDGPARWIKVIRYDQDTTQVTNPKLYDVSHRVLGPLDRRQHREGCLGPQRAISPNY